MLSCCGPTDYRSRRQAIDEQMWRDHFPSEVQSRGELGVLAAGVTGKLGSNARLFFQNPALGPFSTNASAQRDKPRNESG